MSNIIEKTIKSLFRNVTAASELLLRKFTYNEMRWTNPAAVAGTVAIAELAIGSIKAPSRLVEAKLVPSSGGITANATHYLTLLVAARGAASPFTSRNLITYAADTTTTDDATQWNEKDLSSYFNATLANLDVAEGEVITVAATKTGSDGLGYPAGTVELRFRPRDT